MSLFSLSSIKRSLIRGISDDDILEAIKKIDELSDKYEIVVHVQRQNGEIEAIKLLTFEVHKAEPKSPEKLKKP